MFTAKVVAITGATGALGQALVRRFSAEKAVLVLIDRDEKALRKLSEELSRQGVEAGCFVCDFSHSENLTALMREILVKFPAIDLWINNAGITRVGAFAEQTQAEWEKVIEINFLATVRLTRLVLPVMQKRGCGKIVNLASVAGAVPAPWMTSYTASKHAVVGFTRALQEELRQQSSHVEMLLVTPGFFESALIQSEQASFPEWLKPVLGDPQSVAGEILSALRKNRRESTPTLNGKLMMALYKSFPVMVTRSSKMLLTRGPLDLILNRYTVPK